LYSLFNDSNRLLLNQLLYQVRYLIGLFQWKHMSSLYHGKRNTKFLFDLLRELAGQKWTLLSHDQMYRNFRFRLRQPPQRRIGSKEGHFTLFRNGELYPATNRIILQGMLNIGLDAICIKVLIKAFRTQQRCCLFT